MHCQHIMSARASYGGGAQGRGAVPAVARSSRYWSREWVWPMGCGILAPRDHVKRSWRLSSSQIRGDNL